MISISKKRLLNWRAQRNWTDSLANFAFRATLCHNNLLTRFAIETVWKFIWILSHCDSISNSVCNRKSQRKNTLRPPCWRWLNFVGSIFHLQKIKRVTKLFKRANGLCISGQCGALVRLTKWVCVGDQRRRLLVSGVPVWITIHKRPSSLVTILGNLARVTRVPKWMLIKLDSIW